jgi:hypothetical protein
MCFLIEYNSSADPCQITFIEPINIKKSGKQKCPKGIGKEEDTSYREFGGIFLKCMD